MANEPNVAFDSIAELGNAVAEHDYAVDSLKGLGKRWLGDRNAHAKGSAQEGSDEKVGHVGFYFALHWARE
jgi:hypothetical protein